MAWAADHAAELGADPDRLALVGAGSGAALAERVAELAVDEGWPPLRHVALIWPHDDPQAALGRLAAPWPRRRPGGAMSAALAERAGRAASTPSTVTRAPSHAWSSGTARELYVHCVRILRSPEQAEDALQEALLRAWRSRAGYAGRSTFRAWLYRIATNACLDEIRRDRARPRRQPAVRLVPLDDEAQLPPAATASTEPGPGRRCWRPRRPWSRPSCAAIELLPPRQRAVLILCEVLRCPAAETAALLDTRSPR